MSRLLLLIALLGQSDLADDLSRLIREGTPKDARTGMVVALPQSDTTLFALREDEPFILGSNTKIFTTACALAKLGKDFTFRTRVLVGPIQDGSARDLTIIAGGDPNISGRFYDGDPTAIFKQWRGALEQAGVRAIQTEIVLVDTAFDDVKIYPTWQRYDLSRWWAAPVSALALNDNCVDVTVAPAAREGEPGLLSLSPETRFVTLINKTKTVKKGGGVDFSRKDGTNTITVTGSVALEGMPQGFNTAVNDPERYFGTVLVETLRAGGIRCTGNFRIAREHPNESTLREIVTTGHDLIRTVTVCNRVSQNLYAEMLFRTLGWKLRGKGTQENALAVINDFLTELNLEGITLTDGSGLSRENTASPRQMVAFFRAMRNQTYWKNFSDSLPTNGGTEGTLKKRMTEARLKGRIRAKTGHVSGVACLSGYAQTESGELLIFSILINGVKGDTSAADQLQDRICERLIRYRRE